MAGNQGNQNQGGGQQSKAAKTCYICNTQTTGDKVCEACRNFRFVDCPHCGAKNVPNGPTCLHCTKDLSSMKIGGGTKSGASQKKDDLNLEVTPSVVGGKGSIRNQYTENGKGLQTYLWLGIKSTLVKCYSNGTDHVISARKPRGYNEISKLQTDNEGLLVVRVNFDGCAKVQMTVAAVGTQADLKRPVTLQGPKFQPSGITAIHFWRRFKQVLAQIIAARNYSKLS